MRTTALFLGLSVLLAACGETPTTPAGAPATPQFAVAVHPPTTGLVAHWTLDGNATDVGPNALGGALIGPVTPAADPDGVANGAMSFGGGGHIRIPHSPLLNFADFTISFLVKPTALQFGNIITKGRDGLNGYEFRYLASGELSLDLVNGNRWAGDPIVGYVKAPVPVGSWHQVTGVVNNATLTTSLYVDGVLAAEGPMVQPYATTSTYPLVFGRHYTYADAGGGFPYPFAGSLDDVRMYARALTPSEIRGLQPALIARWMGEGNALDALGVHHGLASGALGYAPSMVAQGFNILPGNNVTVPDAWDLNPPRMTLSAWVYPRRVSGGGVSHQDLVSKDGERVQRQYLLTISAPNNRFRAHICGAGGFRAVDGGTVVVPGRWYHVAQTYDGQTLRLFVNGVEDGAIAVGLAPCATNEPFRIGGGASGGSTPYWFDGIIDDVRLYGRALAPAELQALQPRPAVIAPLGAAELLEGETVALAGSFTDDGMIHQWSAAVDYGDGGGTEPLALVGNTFTLSHLYGTAGTYTVTVTVGDDWGNVSHATAAVEVLAPSAAAGALEEEIAALVTSGGVAAEAQSALEASLGEAMDSYAKGNPVAGNNQMGAFINKVEAGLKSGNITAAAGAWLIAQAQRIIQSGQGQTKDVGKGKGKE